MWIGCSILLSQKEEDVKVQTKYKINKTKGLTINK